jgi:predicted DCC family thiol-disulfide oxidoreductase YuxK
VSQIVGKALPTVSAWQFLNLQHITKAVINQDSCIQCGRCQKSDSTGVEECEKSVQLIKGNYRSSGARAIADLLTLAGGSYRAAAMTVRTLGKLSDFGYEWIARNRGSELVIKISQFLPEDPDPLD